MEENQELIVAKTIAYQLLIYHVKCEYENVFTRELGTFIKEEEQTEYSDEKCCKSRPYQRCMRKQNIRIRPTIPRLPKINRSKRKTNSKRLRFWTRAPQRVNIAMKTWFLEPLMRIKRKAPPLLRPSVRKVSGC